MGEVRGRFDHRVDQKRLLGGLALVAGVVLIWSAIRPHDYPTWLFEISLGLAGIAVLFFTYRRFPFSNLVYVFVLLHFIILAVGAKYTYAEEPLFNWLRDTFGLARNYFDRVGHFAQGFTPALLTREFLLRVTPLRPGKMLFFLTVSVCLAMSAFYELLEMWVVFAFYPKAGPEWLGLQGDPWDAQWDITMALGGAILSYALLRKAHDRSSAALHVNKRRVP